MFKRWQLREASRTADLFFNSGLLRSNLKIIRVVKEHSWPPIQYREFKSREKK